MKYYFDRFEIQFILNDMYWFLSDDINCYMEMLFVNINKDVYMVDVGWFSYKVIDSVFFNIFKCDMFQLQCKSVNWFEKFYIVILINI